MAKLNLLTPGTQNPKTAKPAPGTDRVIVNDLLHLAPSTKAAAMAANHWEDLCDRADRQGWGHKLREFGQARASKIDTCTSASAGCRAACLNVSGKGEMSGIHGYILHRARALRTLRYYADRSGFMAAIEADIRKRFEQAAKAGAEYACRINGTSDLPGLARILAIKFPGVQFYDYTAHPKPWARTLPNYHVTFSRKENNDRDCLLALQNGINVAVAFSTRRGKPLPETFMGRPVIDGDLHDLRFLDPKGGVIVGLRVKGHANSKDQSGFIVRVD